jgi:hypothetical protein
MRKNRNRNSDIDGNSDNRDKNNGRNAITVRKGIRIRMTVGRSVRELIGITIEKVRRQELE